MLVADTLNDENSFQHSITESQSLLPQFTYAFNH